MQGVMSVPNDKVAIIVNKIDLKNNSFYISPESVSLGRIDEIGYFITENGEERLPSVENSRFFNNTESKTYAFLTSIDELKRQYPEIEDVSFLLYCYFQDVLKSVHILFQGDKDVYLCSADYKAYSDKIVGSATKRIDEELVKKEEIVVPEILIPTTTPAIDSIGLENYLKERIFDNDDILEDIATIIANNQRAVSKSEVQSILSIGPSGSGKTATFEAAAEFLDLPITIYDCNELTAQGYVGDSIPDIMKAVYESSNRDVKRASKSILVLDEIDKLAMRGSNVKDADVQYALLKLFDGYSYNFETKKNGPTVNLDSSFMTIAGLGAFPDLFKTKTMKSIGFGSEKNSQDEVQNFTPEDFVKFGIIAELYGRLNNQFIYKPLDKDGLKRVLKDSKASLLKLKLDGYLRDFGIDTILDDSFIDALVEKCFIDLIGGRGIARGISHTFIKLDRELNHRKELCKTMPKKIVLTKELVENNRSFNI